jgi:heme/copper-type cytochrome/quinol oxidase subunit 2
MEKERILNKEKKESQSQSQSQSQISFSYDSIPIQEKDLKSGGKRLLEVSNPLYIPIGLPIRFLVTSADVLHSWSVPEFGIKTDAVPGRLNQVITTVYKPGLFFGQCSELCGVAHYYMPILVESLPITVYNDFS